MEEKKVRDGRRHGLYSFSDVLADGLSGEERCGKGGGDKKKRQTSVSFFGRKQEGDVEEREITSGTNTFVGRNGQDEGGGVWRERGHKGREAWKNKKKNSH